MRRDLGGVHVVTTTTNITIVSIVGIVVVVVKNVVAVARCWNRKAMNRDAADTSQTGHVRDGLRRRCAFHTLLLLIRRRRGLLLAHCCCCSLLTMPAVCFQEPMLLIVEVEGSCL